MSWIVRKYVAYLVFNKDEGENSETYAFEPSTNKVAPAIFEAQICGIHAYSDALIKARELNAANKHIEPIQ